MKRSIEAWIRFWFAPGANDQLAIIRIAMCLVAAVWFASFWSDVDVWFGNSGLLATGLSAKLVAFEELAGWEVWSPLWWTDSSALVRGWLAFGILLSILAGVGVGGRWSLALLALWMVAWAHRIVWLTGIVEPAIIAFTVYMIVEPGPGFFSWPGLGSRQRSDSWQATTAIRLLQTHAWILLAATVLTQLAGIVWWRGEAVWWLAAAGRSNYLSVESLRDRPLLVNGLTHAFIAVELLALWLLLTRGGRLLGLCCGWLSCLAIALIADQGLYGLLLGCALLAFVDWPTKTLRTGTR